MNMKIGTVAAQILFLEYLFQIFGMSAVCLLMYDATPLLREWLRLGSVGTQGGFFPLSEKQWRNEDGLVYCTNVIMTVC